MDFSRVSTRSESGSTVIVFYRAAGKGVDVTEVQHRSGEGGGGANLFLSLAAEDRAARALERLNQGLHNQVSQNGWSMHVSACIRGLQLQVTRGLYRLDSESPPLEAASELHDLAYCPTNLSPEGFLQRSILYAFPICLNGVYTNNRELASEHIACGELEPEKVCKLTTKGTFTINISTT